MPQPYVKKLANKHDVSIDKSESRWAKAKKQAAIQGHKDDFSYVTGIYKNMMGESAKNLEFKRFLTIVEMDDVSDMGYGTDDELDDELENDFSDDSDCELDCDQENDFSDDSDCELDCEEHLLTDIIDLDDEGNNDDELEVDDSNEIDDSEVLSKLGEGEGTTLRMKAKNRVNIANAGIKQRDKTQHPSIPKYAMDKQTQKQAVKSITSQGQVGSKEKYRKDWHGVAESENDLTFLQSLLITEKTKQKKKKSLKQAAKSVYHRDYMRTKDKPYRQYHADHNED